MFNTSFLIILFFALLVEVVSAQSAMTNPQSRNVTSLNGEWKVLPDPVNAGEWRQVWLEKKPQKKTDFVEYSFDGAPVLQVPGDFNSQMRELSYFEGIVWYKRTFNYELKNDKRLFLYFGAVNYLADVYLNGEKIGSHEGGFTPFQFEITKQVKNGANSLIVKVNNNRKTNQLPGTGYDWFNYGGITRDVNLIETNSTYIEDYCIQLKKGSTNTVSGWMQLNGMQTKQSIHVKIPELKLVYRTSTDEKGFAKLVFASNSLSLWTPTNPKLYKVVIESETDSVIDTIGFRSIEVKGNQVLLNKKQVFLKAVNIHEENPYLARRAYSLDDARLLLSHAKDLGCNMIRLAHYPHNEHIVKEAEKLGLMVWSELPVYQHIEFADSAVSIKMQTMLEEMIRRDKNRCGIIIWSLSNETYPGTPNRNNALIKLTQKCRALDSTRLVTHVINTQKYENNGFDVWDTLYKYSDLIAINEYIGWYVPWQGRPADTKWKLMDTNKPVFISEFGGEALYGSKGPADEAAFWTEEYQEKIYVDQIEMFNTVPNLCGVCAWLLFDYRSPVRMHPVYQKGYNRKGLLSAKGEKKKAWYVLSEYYKRN